MHHTISAFGQLQTSGPVIACFTNLHEADESYPLATGGICPQRSFEDIARRRTMSLEVIIDVGI